MTAGRSLRPDHEGLTVDGYYTSEAGNAGVDDYGVPIARIGFNIVRTSAG